MILLFVAEISLDIVGLVSLAITGLVFFYKVIFRPFFRKVKFVYDEICCLSELRSKVTSIYNELNPNGGESVKDTINRIEGKLMSVEQKQNIYLLESPQGIFEADKDGKFINVNRTYMRMVGKSERELLGMNWVNSVAEYDQSRVLEAWSNSLTNNIEFIYKFDMVDSNQNFFSVSVTAYPIEQSGSKKTIGWVGTITPE